MKKSKCRPLYLSHLLFRLSHKTLFEAKKRRFLVFSLILFRFELQHQLTHEGAVLTILVVGYQLTVLVGREL